MAENTLTALIPDIYAALDVTSREITGMIASVTMDARADRAALDQSVVVDVEPDYSAGDAITPAMAVPDPTGETSGSVEIVITNSKSYSFGFNGEGQRGLQTGAGYLTAKGGKIAQRIRTLVNDVEADLTALHTTTSRAYGAVGTVPFGTAGNFTDATYAKEILISNGAPDFDNQLVMSTIAAANMTGLQASANIAGTDSIQRQGILLPLAGMDLRQSAQIVTSTAGTKSGGKTNNAGYAIGATAFGLQNATGTGVLVAGDIITFTGDTNKYVVATAVFAGANPATGDLVTLAAPGLKKAVAASNVAITVLAATPRHMVFNRSAIVLAARAPARPEEGDLATDVMMVTDPRSGLTFEFSMYKGYRKVRYEVALAWGVKNIKPAHTALLIG